MNDFDYDVRNRKMLANQSRHRKCGSKSKKCSLPSDHMTKKQWNERCGKVMTYQINKPMTWEEFKNLPNHIKREYVNNLVSKFATSASDLGKMFGVTGQSVLNLCKKELPDLTFSRGSKMSNDQKEAFNAFVNGKGLCPAPVNAAEDMTDVVYDAGDEALGAVAVDRDMLPSTSVGIEDSRKSDDMTMTEFNMQFKGKFDKNMLYNSIASMIHAGTNVKISIKCEIEE